MFSKDPFNRLLSDRGWDHVAVVYCQEGGEVLLFEALLEFGVILNNAARLVHFHFFQFFFFSFFSGCKNLLF